MSNIEWISIYSIKKTNPQPCGSSERIELWKFGTDVRHFSN